MNKLLTILLGSALHLGLVGQVPVIIMTTEQAMGSTFSFSLQGNAIVTPIQVDFGNGTLINDTIGTFVEQISGTIVGSQTIKVYGYNITYLDCSNCELSQLDIGQNSILQTLICSNNNLTEMHLGNSLSLTRLYCDNNQLTFYVLPYWSTAKTITYEYAPQKPISIAKNCATGDITFSLQQSTTTVYSWKTKSGSILIEGIDYEIFMNRIIFLKAQADSIYCEMTNNKFPDFAGSNVLKTTNTLVTGPDFQVMTMTTTKPYARRDAYLSFGIKSEVPHTQIRILSERGDALSNTIDTTLTTAHIMAQGTQVIKIFGTGINYFDCSRNELIALDVAKNDLLTSLICSINKLSALDVTKNTKLKILKCFDNQLSTLDITKNTDLKSFEVSINKFSTLDVTKHIGLTELGCGYNQLTTLDVTKNTALTRLMCRNNALTTLDITKNTALTSLDCAENELSTIDLTNINNLNLLDVSGNKFNTLEVAKYTNLTSLGCGNNQLSTLDVTNNIALKYLYCDSNLFTTVDVSKNIALNWLDVSGNKLTTLDITNNKILRILYCSNNQLSVLDLTNNTELVSLLCDNNQFTFSSLPKVQSIKYSYKYAPQKPIPIAKKLAAEDTIDLTKEFMVYGFATAYTWKSLGSSILVQGTDYIFSDGNTVFLKAQTDSIYCEMTNFAFPGFSDSIVLRTTNVMITFSNVINEINAFGLKLYTEDKMLYISSPCNAQLSVFDLNGRLVMCLPISKGNSNQQLPFSGLYIVKLISDRDMITRKLLIE